MMPPDMAELRLVTLDDLAFKFEEPRQVTGFALSAFICDSWAHLFDVPTLVSSGSCLAIIERAFGAELGVYWLWCRREGGEVDPLALEAAITFALSLTMRGKRRSATDGVLSGFLAVLSHALHHSVRKRGGAHRDALAPSDLNDYSPQKFERRARLILAGKWVSPIVFCTKENG